MEYKLKGALLLLQRSPSRYNEDHFSREGLLPGGAHALPTYIIVFNTIQWLCKEYHDQYSTLNNGKQFSLQGSVRGGLMVALNYKWEAQAGS